ncbi:tyrosine-type recombinase/integrase [Bifidobacterium pullorum]|uniref:tyrosine-type recombinase/integrase n=1 Tax=Bifidobacterium pullorum TaxID=78448 RepID=UPI00242FCF46|nr:site-specific integrase [Bifidobacterium pullorum]
MVSYEKYALGGGGTRWRVWWRDPDHKRRNKSSFRTKRDAEAWAAEHVTTAISRGSYVDPSGGKALIGPLGDAFIAAHETVWKPSHFHSEETSWRVHVKPRWGDRRLESVNHSEVQTWVNELAKTKSASVVIRAFGILKSIYETAVKDGRITRTPVEDIKCPKKTRKPRVYLTPEQLLTLANCSGEYRPLVLLLGLCGLRWGEATALTVGDVDFEKNRIHVSKSVTKVGKDFRLGTPKSNRSRDVPMNKLVRDALATQVSGKDDDDLLFTSPDGGYVAPQSIGKNHRCWYKTALIKAGVPMLTIHDLRHTAASIAVHSGANVKAIQRMLGHSSAAMTLDTYADLFDDDLDELAGRIDATMTDVLNAD